jgi:hypothetical protein
LAEDPLYDTKELSAPTTNTKRIQSADPDNTRPFCAAHPFCYQTPK